MSRYASERLPDRRMTFDADAHMALQEVWRGLIPQTGQDHPARQSNVCQGKGARDIKQNRLSWEPGARWEASW